MQVASSDLGKTHSIRGGDAYGNVVKTGDRADFLGRHLFPRAKERQGLEASQQ